MAAMAMTAGARAEAFLERVVAVADRLSGHRLGDFANSSGYVRQSSSPFGQFGAVAAAGSRPLPISRTIMETAVFTVEEARERLASFLDGRFVPDSLAELIEYLGERFLRLETRVMPGGRIANYLVDSRTNQGVPAAQVDPKLGHKAMLAARLRSSLRQQVGASDPADVFHSWQGMALVLGNSRSQVAYTVCDGQAWYGRVHAVAGMDAVANDRIVRAAREAGLQLVLPLARDGGLVPGMPILLRSASLKAEDVHPGLSHARLSASFGKGMPETYRGLAQRAESPVSALGRDKVVSMREFRERFARRGPVDDFPEADSTEAAEAIGFGGLGGRSGSRDLVLVQRDPDTAPLVFDRDLGEEVPIAVRALPAGRYGRVSPDGVPAGHAIVSPDGRVTLYAPDGSMDRPRPEPPVPDVSPLPFPSPVARPGA